MCYLKFISLLHLFCFNLCINAFNLDTLDYVQYRGESDSMFGFSVAAHKDREYNWVLIGAPQANSLQPGVSHGGAVYYCPTDRDEGCRLLNFDRSGNNNSSSGHQIDEKSGQWFGATVHSGGPDKPIVACAPRYLWFTLKNGRRDPVGTCYVSSSDFRDFSEFSPCRTRHWGYHRQGTCQAGLGAAISKNGQRLFIGAPGSWYWQGQMYSIDPDAKLPFTPPRYSNYGTSAGQLYSQDLKKRPAVLFTKEGQPLDDDSYLGYSVTSGNFTGEKETGIAAGMPRGSRLVGKVLLYTWNLTNHQNISGSQLGAYFGYAVAAADVNGDGLDDLIVGAPLHTEPNNEGKYEIGRIYVIYPVKLENDPDANSNSKWPRLRNFDKIDGANSKGRFGLSVTSLGDLDLDGYHDIAVGAPYSGPNGRGAVYIYYGSKKGIRQKMSQVIYAEDVSQTAMYTFGFSVSGSGIDLDNNNYPDLVIGAYKSNTAFIFRSQPVINVEASIKFKTANSVISLDEKNCTINHDRRVVCTSFEACVKYNGIGVNNILNLIMEFNLDAKKSKDPRIFSYHADRRQKFNDTWTLRRNDEQCKNIQVYIRENTRDKLTPLEVQMKYHLYKEQNSATLTHNRNPRSNLQAVLNGNSPSIVKDSIDIRKNCGSDDVCIPDLRLHVKSNVDKYLLGSGKKLELDVIVKNEGEDSFESMFYMKLPPGINYFNTEKLTGSIDIPVKCSPPSESTNNTLKCDIGNPLPKDKLVHFKVMLDPFNIEGMSPSYDFTMLVNSTNKENNMTISDNVESLTIDIWVKTNLSLTGWAHSPDIHYKENQYKENNFTSETDIGPQVVHIYSIKNNGPSDIIEAEVLFMWPSQTLGGDDMLYIMEQPETSGSIVCERVPEVNYLNLELLPKKYYLEADSNTASGKVALEEKLTTNVASSVSGRHEDKNDGDDKLDDTGDASYIHVHRGKERTSSYSGGSATSTATATATAAATGTASSTGTVARTPSRTTSTSTTTTTKIDQRYLNSNPSHSWITKNTTTITTDHDGTSVITTSSNNNNNNKHHHHHHVSGVNSNENGNNYKIYYTSTGNQYNNRFGESDQNKEINYSVSGESNFKQHNKDHDARLELSSRHPNYENKIESESTQYGTVHHSSQPTSYRQNSYFNWNNANNNKNTLNQTDSGHNIGDNKRFIISTEESVNEGLDEYTRTVTHDRRNKVIFGEQHNSDGISGIVDGNEFKTTAINLGTLSNTNGEENFEQNKAEHDSHMYYDPDLGSYEERNSEKHSHSVTYGGSSRPYNSGGGSGSGKHSTTYHTSSSSSGSSSGSSSSSNSGSSSSFGATVHHNTSPTHINYNIRHSGDNVPTEHPTDIDYRNRIYRNKRRTDSVDDDISNIIDCKSTKCSIIKCKAGPLVKDEEAWTALRFRGNAATMKKVGWTQIVTISSMMVSRINKLPYIGTPNERPIHTHEVFTNMTLTETEIKPDVVPLWVVVLSACAGAIILLLLVFLLYKCGFFKRNRPSDVPERQPLNRNGHYQGDEQL